MITVETIPEVMRSRPQWIAWRLAERNGKSTKLPINARTGGSASTTDVATWASFEAASAYAYAERLGVGFVFSSDDPFCGIDLDSCVTNGETHEAALRIIKAFGSYTEFSVSGNGLHIICEGHIARGRRKDQGLPWGGGIEIYSQARYFTVSGRHLADTPVVPRGAQPQIDRLLSTVLKETGPIEGQSSVIGLVEAGGGGVQGDEELLAQARAAKNGQDFERLFNGDWSGYATQSHADLALCAHLSFWTGGDPERIDSLFRRSGLMRDKWLRDDYRTITVTKAINGSGDFYTPPSTESRSGQNGDDPQTAHLPAEGAPNGDDPQTAHLPQRGGWPEPMRPEAFHGVAGQIVRAAEPETEADPQAILLTLLTYCGNVFGRSPHFWVAEAQHYANEFVAIVGETGAGGRKGTSASVAIRPVALADATFYQRKSTGLSSGEGVIQAVRDPKWKVRKPKNKNETPDEDGLYRELEDEGVDDKRLCILEPELSAVFRKMARSGNVLEETLDDAWDGHPLSTLTRNSLKATGAHISIVGHTTPSALRETLSDTTLLSGLGNRILWCLSKRSKILPRGGDGIDWMPHMHSLKDAFSFARFQSAIGMNEDAWELWSREYERLTSGPGGLLGAATNRGEAHTRRLAMIYAILDRSDIVQLEHLQAALAVWDYCFDSARYLFGDKTGDPVADVTISALRRAGSRGMTRNEIYDLFSRNQRGPQIEIALELLRQRNLAHCRSESTGGRPAERWFWKGGE